MRMATPCKSGLILLSCPMFRDSQSGTPDCSVRQRAPNPGIETARPGSWNTAQILALIRRELAAKPRWRAGCKVAEHERRNQLRTSVTPY
jgi:hypothetical protein